jgi:hypothetical protein
MSTFGVKRFSCRTRGPCLRRTPYCSPQLEPSPRLTAQAVPQPSRSRPGASRPGAQRLPTAARQPHNDCITSCHSVCSKNMRVGMVSLARVHLSKVILSKPVRVQSDISLQSPEGSRMWLSSSIMMLTRVESSQVRRQVRRPED